MHQIINFARDTLGVKLHPGQADALEGYYLIDRHNWLLLAGRRSGKSLISDVIACYEAIIPDFTGMVRPGEERYILLVSVRQDSAQLHIRNIHKLLSHTKAVKSMIVKVTEDRIILSNGCVILSLPASARAARGYTASTLILDEAAYFVDTLGNSSAEAIYTALEPTTATFGDMARVIITTSVGAKTGLVYDLYDRATQGELEDWQVTKAPTREMNPAVSEKTVARALKRDPEGGAAEYECEFRERTEAFLNFDDIERCIDRGLTRAKKGAGERYLMAIDPALMRDNYGFGIAHLSAGVVIVDYLYRLTAPVNANAAEDLLKSLHERFKPSGILCDNASTVQRLKNDLPMVYTPFTRPMKLKIYGALKESINLGLVVIPNEPDLLDELRALQIRGGVDISAPKSGRITHDDLADVLALLVDGLVSGNYSPGESTALLDPTNCAWEVFHEGRSYEESQREKQQFVNQFNKPMPDYNPENAQRAQNVVDMFLYNAKNRKG